MRPPLTYLPPPEPCDFPCVGIAMFLASQAIIESLLEFHVKAYAFDLDALSRASGFDLADAITMVNKNFTSARSQRMLAIRDAFYGLVRPLPGVTSRPELHIEPERFETEAIAHGLSGGARLIHVSDSIPISVKPGDALNFRLKAAMDWLGRFDGFEIPIPENMQPLDPTALLYICAPMAAAIHEAKILRSATSQAAASSSGKPRI